jgi:hypothetical protein
MSSIFTKIILTVFGRDCQNQLIRKLKILYQFSVLKIVKKYGQKGCQSCPVLQRAKLQQESRFHFLGSGFPFPDQVEDRFHGNTEKVSHQRASFQRAKVLQDF